MVDQPTSSSAPTAARDQSEDPAAPVSRADHDRLRERALYLGALTREAMPVGVPRGAQGPYEALSQALAEAEARLRALGRRNASKDTSRDTSGEAFE